MKTGATGFKVKKCRGTITIVATASSLAKETEGLSIVGANKACSNGRSRENKCEDGILKSADRVCILEPIYNRCRQEKKLL